MSRSLGPAGDAMVAHFLGRGDIALPLGDNGGGSSFISSILETAHHPTLALDCAFEIVAANSQARALLGLDAAMLPAPAAEFVGADAMERIEEFFPVQCESAATCFTVNVVKGSGPGLPIRATRLIDAAGRTIGVLIVVLGSLWRRSALAEACRPERVELLGLYSAGIVHEFNNLLSVICGRAGLGLMADGPAAKDRALENVVTAARRAEHITKNLLTYVQRREPRMLLVDLRKPVAEAIGLLEIEFAAARVEVVRKLDELPPVMCDPVQVSQVCFNLLRNARDAMPDGGTVTVVLKRCHKWAAFSVSDTGRGIPPEMHGRIFEPFVSCGALQSLKPSGTGLGLFVTREIVLAHGGDISVESAVAKGACFTVRLPLARQQHPQGSCL